MRRFWASTAPPGSAPPPAWRSCNHGRPLEETEHVMRENSPIHTVLLVFTELLCLMRSLSTIHASCRTQFRSGAHIAVECRHRGVSVFTTSNIRLKSKPSWGEPGKQRRRLPVGSGLDVRQLLRLRQAPRPEWRHHLNVASEGTQNGEAALLCEGSCVEASCACAKAVPPLKPRTLHAHLQSSRSLMLLRVKQYATHTL
jgi:hypothetical protein